VDRETLRAELRDRFELDGHPLRLAGEDRTGWEGLTLRWLRFVASRGDAVRGLLLEPARPAPSPAILYIHAHGGQYGIGASELLDGLPALQSALGPALAHAGFRVLAIDLPCFGERSTETESAAAKAALWWGGSLAGRMLGELAAALGWLAADPGTDPARVGVFGLSMGATFAYWLAAAEPRLAVAAHLCCFADFAPLIESGAHDRHGPYLTVPGLLRLATNGEIAGLIAPRPQFIGLGDADPLTPPSATAPALASLCAAYRDSGAASALRLHREPASGHAETPAMRRALLAFLGETIGAVPTATGRSVAS
jgi:dienelactone hydrolase